jgi:hypothetical protein
MARSGQAQPTRSSTSAANSHKQAGSQRRSNAAVVAAVATVVAAIIAMVQSRMLRCGEARERHQADRTLDERLAQTGNSIRQSARLVEEMSAELEVRAAAARELEEKAKEAEALAALNKEQADAVERLVNASGRKRQEGHPARQHRDRHLVVHSWRWCVAAGDSARAPDSLSNDSRASDSQSAGEHDVPR